MRVGVVGINHRTADLRFREQLAKACQRCFRKPGALGPGSSVVLLSTCNRTEVYFSSEEVCSAQYAVLNTLRTEVSSGAEECLYSYFGYDCFLHVVQVTAGLDSAIIGETEIQGQVKGAYEAAAKQQRLSSEIHFMFQKALKISKETRTQLLLGRSDFDVEHAVLEEVQGHRADGLILFVGASDINHKIFHYFHTRYAGRTRLCNRSLEHAKAFLGKHETEILPWHDLQEWTCFDAVIFGTKCPDYLLTRDMYPDPGGVDCLLIDLSVPRNVEPALSGYEGVRLLNVDQINEKVSQRRACQHQQVLEAEELTAMLTRKQLEIFSEKEKQRAQWVAVGA